VPLEQLNPGLPADLQRIIGKGLEKDRELRYHQASEMRADLQRLNYDRDGGRSGPAAAIDAVPARARRVKLWVSIAAAVIAVGTVYRRTPPLTLIDLAVDVIKAKVIARSLQKPSEVRIRALSASVDWPSLNPSSHVNVFWRASVRNCCIPSDVP
jgi:hypothetical protein